MTASSEPRPGVHAGYEREKLAHDRAALTMIQPEPFNAEAPPLALQDDITPNNFHYVRSNFPLPEHDGTLEISGAVDKPITLTLDDLRAMPAVEHVVTMECAGNGRLGQAPLPAGEPWGFNAVSTASWTGALLHQVLAMASPTADGVDVAFSGADHGRYAQAGRVYEDLTYVRALTLAEAADPAGEILIAYAMNGEELPADHGAPFRIIAPRWYGVASVKWLKSIKVLTAPYEGEFQTSHYMYEWEDRPREPVTLMAVRARITDPAPGATIPAGTYTVRGKAWSGFGPITQVDVSLTGGTDWQPATLEPQKDLCRWQNWSFDWPADAPGRHTLRARATDAAGNVQPAVPPWNRLGYGNNAIEVSYVDVR